MWVKDWGAEVGRTRLEFLGNRILHLQDTPKNKHANNEQLSSYSHNLYQLSKIITKCDQLHARNIIQKYYHNPQRIGSPFTPVSAGSDLG